MKNFHRFALAAILLYSCVSPPEKAESLQDTEKASNKEIEKVPHDEIEVLNIGTFHMDYTPDLHKVEFDENDAGNRKQIEDLCQRIAKFKPTVICVETPPHYDSLLQSKYNAYLHDPQSNGDFYGEIGLVAFEVGRLSNCKRIYGIDHSMGYYYMAIDQLAEELDEPTYMKFKQDSDSLYGRSTEFLEANLIEKIRYINTQEYRDFLMNANADMLMYVNSPGEFEGADEASKFYHRNIRMYANLNRLPLRPDDRVFILMGAAHTSFFYDFFRRSPKYDQLDVLEYLK